MKRQIAFTGSARALAIAEGLVTMLIWSSTFILVKKGLAYVGPLTLAGFRYFLAFLLLLPLLIHRRPVLRSWSGTLWLRLALIGLAAYTLGNGALFWGLKYVPATTGSFLLSLVPLLVLFMGALWLREIPTRWQVIGLGVSLAGALLFFSPGFGEGESRGTLIILAGLFGFAAFTILGRGMARDREVDTLALTAVPLAIGGATSLILAVMVEGWPKLPGPVWPIILFLALVNTAVAYMLYNHAMQQLPALEANMLLNLAPLGTALLAWLILGETINTEEVAGILIVILGVGLVQWGHGKTAIKVR
jgi:drug/metabolite transporter (DMT)-like permease